MNLNSTMSACITNHDDMVRYIKSVEKIRKRLSYLEFSIDKSQSDASMAYLNSDFYMVYLPMIKIFMYTVIILVALIGNILIILVIYYNRSMRNSTNFFIFNLAVCDLAIVFSCTWVQIALNIKKQWIFGEFFCKMNSYMQMVSIIASVLTLSLILFDRYVGIMHPLKARVKRLSSINCYILIWCVWATAAIVSLPTYIYRTYSEREWFDFTEKHCDDFNWPIVLIKSEASECATKITRPFKRIYFTTVILSLFFLPIIIMTTTYGVMIRKLWTTEPIGETDTVASNFNIILKKRKKIVKMLIVMFTIFFICWSPLEIMLLYMEYAETFPIWWNDLEWVCYFFAYSNTAINPYIYAGLSENYKNGLKRLTKKATHQLSSDYITTNNVQSKVNPSAIEMRSKKPHHLSVNHVRSSPNKVITNQIEISSFRFEADVNSSLNFDIKF